MTKEELIKLVAPIINPKNLQDGLIGDAGCVLISGSGKVYMGICVGFN
jgi:hypothetical protein